MRRPSLSRGACARATAIAAVGVAAWPQAALADPPFRLRFGNASLVVPASVVQRAADVDAGRTITLRSASGERRAVQVGGTSVRAVLVAMGLPVDRVRSVELQQGVGRTVTLSGDEVRNGFGGDPSCAACQATLTTTGDGGPIRFVRPLRDAGDANAADELTPGTAQTLYLAVRTDQELRPVDVRVTPGSPRQGQRVTLTASVPGIGPGATYTWFFGDGTSATGARATHVFERGTWPAGVLVTGGGTYGAASRPVNVRPAKERPQANDAVATPTPTATATATPAATGSPGAGGVTGVGTGAGAAPPLATTPTATALPPSTTPQASPIPPTPTPAAPAPALGISPVRGQIATVQARPASLSGALTAAEALADQAARTPPPADRASTPWAAGSAASGMLLLGLLSAGALTELRRARRASHLLS